jgi:hypothetical protein
MTGTSTKTVSQQMEDARWDYRDKMLMHGGDTQHPEIINHPYAQAIRILLGTEAA